MGDVRRWVIGPLEDRVEVVAVEDVLLREDVRAVLREMRGGVGPTMGNFDAGWDDCLQHVAQRLGLDDDTSTRGEQGGGDG